MKTQNGNTMQAVYNIVDLDNEKKPIWTRIGTSFTNRDGSMNVYLDALPLNGKLHIRDFEPRKSAE